MSANNVDISEGNVSALHEIHKVGEEGLIGGERDSIGDIFVALVSMFPKVLSTAV